MVSVAFAIWPSLNACKPARAMPARAAKSAAAKCPLLCLTHSCSKRRASLQGYLTPFWLRYCIATGTGADPDDVDDVPSVSEPHGPDGAMADRRGRGTEISQPRAARRLGQAVRTARRRAGTDLAHLAHLYPPGLRHRQGVGWQSGTGGDRGSR